MKSRVRGFLGFYFLFVPLCIHHAGNWSHRHLCILLAGLSYHHLRLPSTLPFSLWEAERAWILGFFSVQRKILRTDALMFRFVS